MSLKTRLQQRQAREAEILASLKKRKAPEILSAALAALNGKPLSNDPWSFNSVLENQKGSPQAERFISVIRKTRRSSVVESKDMVKAIWLLCGIPWFRELSDWSSRGKTAEARFRSLAAHLSCKFRMPEFLFSVFSASQQNGGLHLVRVFESLASGGSVKSAFEGLPLAPSMTKKMCHEFMQAPRNMTVYEAVRRAQTLASGGGEDLAVALANTRMGRGFRDGNFEDKYLKVIAWFSRFGMLNPDSVGSIFDYIDMRLNDVGFDITGREMRVIQAESDVWHAANARPRTGHYDVNVPEKFAASGVAESNLYEISETEVWSVEEILTRRALETEGAKLKHCVSSYGGRIASGQTSIWSLQREGVRQLTLEVDNFSKRIVQARGVCNARATDPQVKIMHRWAADNNIQVSRLL